MSVYIKFIKSSEKKEAVKQLNEQFGIEELPFLLVGAGREKIRAFTGHLSKEEIIDIAEKINIELVGLYLIKKEHDLRLSFDSLPLLKDQINKNILEINEEEFYLWIRGYDLEKQVPQGTYVIRNKGDLLGCGKSNGQKIFNYVPKDRRIKSRNN